MKISSLTGRGTTPVSQQLKQRASGHRGRKPSGYTQKYAGRGKPFEVMWDADLGGAFFFFAGIQSDFREMSLEQFQRIKNSSSPLREYHLFLGHKLRV